MVQGLLEVLLVGNAGGELRLWNAEDALDTCRVANADLNVGLAAETGGGVDTVAFHEDATDGVEGGLKLCCSDFMSKVDYGAVQLALEVVFSAPVDRDRYS